MPNVLEVQVIGDISGLEKSLKEAEKLQAEYTDSIKKTSDEIAKLNKQKIADKKLGIDVAPLNKQISSLQNNLVELRGNLTKTGFAAEKAAGSIEKASKPIEEVGASASESAGDVTELVTPLLEAGGATAEVTAGANILTSALAGGLAGALSAVAGYLVELYINSKNTITALQEIEAESIKGAQAQISSVGAYVSAAKNINLSMEDRLQAVKNLQDEYPAYFGNLTKEQILNGNVAGAVKGVTQALIAKAKAAALTDRIVKLATEEEDIQNKINNAISEEARLKQLTAKQSFEAGILINKVLRGNLTAQEAFNLASSSKVGYTVIQAQSTLLDDLGSELRTNKSLQDEYTKSLEKSYAASIKLEAETPKKGKEKLQRDEIIPFKTALEPILDVEKTTEALLEVKNEYGKLEEKLIKFDEPVTVPLKIIPQADATLVKNLPLLDELASKYKNLTGQELVLPPVVTDEYVASLKRALAAAELFGNASSAAIGSLASDLTSSLQTGNAALDAFVGSVVQGLAEVAAAQLAGLIAKQAVASTSLSTDAAVATGNAVVAATETASATGPGAAFVLPALVGAAIGFIAAAFSGIKFAHGGVVPGGSFTGDKIPAMLNSGEAVMNQQQQANTLMAIANGNSNSLQGNRKSSTFNLETKLRGADILLALKREEKSR